jgi:hypothetical protein
MIRFHLDVPCNWVEFLKVCTTTLMTKESYLTLTRDFSKAFTSLTDGSLSTQVRTSQSSSTTNSTTTALRVSSREPTREEKTSTLLKLTWTWVFKEKAWQLKKHPKTGKVKVLLPKMTTKTVTSPISWMPTWATSLFMAQLVPQV